MRAAGREDWPCAIFLLQEMQVQTVKRCDAWDDTHPGEIKHETFCTKSHLTNWNLGWELFWCSSPDLNRKEIYQTGVFIAFLGANF